MRRAAAILLTSLTVLSCTSAAWSQLTTPDGFSAVATAELYDGVEYVKLSKNNRPLITHVAHVLPGADIDLRVVNAHDKISKNSRDLETTSSMCKRVHCIVGVNGDFHKLGAPAGGVIVDGRMLHSPDPDRPQLTLTKDGHLVAGTYPWSGTLSTSDGSPAPAVATVNEAPPVDGVALFTPDYGSNTDLSTRTELVVKGSGLGTLNQAKQLELVSIRIGPGPIPSGGAVLSGDGAAAQQLQDLFARRQAITVRLQISSPVDADMSIGAEPVVLRDGKPATPWRDPNVINPRQPHTLVGWNKQGHVYLVAVDGRQDASDGMSMAEAANFLLSLGVTDAVNLDGGGGTTFVAGGSVWNRPSDDDPTRAGAYDERSATNAFFVMARPGAPLPPQTPPAPAPLPTPVTGVVKPLDVEPLPSAGGAIGGGVIYGPGPGPSSSPKRSGGPTAANPTGRFGPVVGVGGQLASGELPVGPWLRGAGRGSPTLSATPAGDPAADGSVAGGTPSDLVPGSTTESTYGDYLGKSLPLAAGGPGSLIAFDENAGPSPIPVLLVGLAGITSLSLGLLGRRRWERYSAIRAYELEQLPQ
jgi:hypothetical protein